MIKNFIPRTLKKLKLLPRLNYRHSINVAGTSIIIPVIKGIGLDNRGITEEWMISILKALVPQKNGAFVDVGVNLGQTLIKLKALFPQQKYLGFEPNPVCLFYCRELIENNRFTNCEIVPVGLSDTTGIVVLSGTSDIDAAGTIIENFRTSKKLTSTQFVPVFKFEDVVTPATKEKIGFVKIDVEGAELEVLSGLRNKIATDRPFISCEILPAYQEDNPRVARQNKIEAILKELNYSLYRVLNGQHVEKLTRIEIHGDLDLCEYLFVPAEDQALFATALTKVGASIDKR